MMDTKDSQKKKQKVFLLFTFMVLNFKFIYSSYVLCCLLFFFGFLVEVFWRCFSGRFLLLRLHGFPFSYGGWQKWDGSDDGWWKGQFITSNGEKLRWFSFETWEHSVLRVCMSPHDFCYFDLQKSQKKHLFSSNVCRVMYLPKHVPGNRLPRALMRTASSH